MENKPIIAVTPLVDFEKESLWMLPGYVDGIKEAGGIPLTLPLTEDLDDIDRLVRLCDGFLFTGGHDVSPSLYVETPLAQCGKYSESRDRTEKPLLDRALRLNKPIFGICRGIQFLNVCLGGTLWQDLPTQYKSDVGHCQKPPYDMPAHDVIIDADTPLGRLLQTKRLAVNSYHHQAIKKLSPLLRPMAKSRDGLIEAVYMPDKRFVWAVQWHPEFNYKVSAESRRLFSSFVIAAKISANSSNTRKR